MKKLSISIVMVAVLCFFVVTSFGQRSSEADGEKSRAEVVQDSLVLAANMKAAKAEAAKKAQAEKKGKINWMTWQEAIEASKKEPRKLFIDVYTHWCGWCKRMDATTFSDAQLAEYVNENYYAVKMNAEMKEPIEFGGKEYKFVANGRRGYHELAATLLNGKLSYPSLVFLDEGYNMIQPLPGYRKAPELDRILKFIGGNFYKNTAYEAFLENYNSPYN